MDEALPIIFLAVALKIPIFLGMWLIWWAVRAEPELEDQPGAGESHPFRRWRREPRGPKPRRGPHGGGAAEPRLDCPPGGRRRTPLIEPRPVPGTAAHERRERTPAGG